MVKVSMILQNSGGKPYQWAYVARDTEGKIIQSGGVYYSQCSDYASAKHEVERELKLFHDIESKELFFV